MQRIADLSHIFYLTAVASSIGLGYFFTCMFGPTFSILPAVLSAPCNLVWYVATGVALVRMPPIDHRGGSTNTEEVVHDE